MRALHAIVVLLSTLVFPRISSSRGVSPEPVTAERRELRIAKADHTLAVVRDGEVLKTYRVAIGPGGAGPKLREGDRVTPVGTYRVLGRFPLYHQFLSLDYPNADDRRRFAELKAKSALPPGATIGGGIGIHGGTDTPSDVDWTLGCIALADGDLDEVSAFAKDGTRVVITD